MYDSGQYRVELWAWCMPEFKGHDCHGSGTLSFSRQKQCGAYLPVSWYIFMSSLRKWLTVFILPPLWSIMLNLCITRGTHQNCELIHLTCLAESWCILLWVHFLPGDELYPFTGGPKTATPRLIKNCHGARWEIGVCSWGVGKGDRNLWKQLNVCL